MLTQLLFCAGILLFYTFYLSIALTNLNPAFTLGCFLLPVTLAMINVFCYYLIPNYLFKQRYFWFGLYSLYTVVIANFIIVVSGFYGVLFVNFITALNSEIPLRKNMYLVIIGVYMVVLIASLFSVFRESYKMHLSNKELQYALLNGQLQLKEQELSYLKMQIHPHFLFNTLNTIYGSAIAKKTHTPQLILKLSNLLDYILYQTQKAQVSLDDELAHLQDYIALEQLRHGERIKIRIDFPVETKGITVAPMLFLPFLENSFKHGKSQQDVMEIDLKIEMKNEKIEFYLSNTFDMAFAKSATESSGIGLVNIKKRLQLVYPEAHALEIERGGGNFVVRLIIDPRKIKTIKA